MTWLEDEALELGAESCTTLADTPWSTHTSLPQPHPRHAVHQSWVATPVPDHQFTTNHYCKPHTEFDPRWHYSERLHPYCLLLHHF